LSLNLTPKQIRFCEEYLIDLNGKQAGIRAGYSPKTAEQQASRMLSNVKVQTYLQELRKSVSKKLEISREMVVSELAKIGFSDIREFYNEDGTLKNIKDLSDSAAAALSGVEVDELWEYDPEEDQKVPIGVTKKIKRWDKVAALANICKILGFYAPEKVINTINLADQPIVFE